jgi:uncharacterized protein YndB with AHSA1/START domain
MTKAPGLDLTTVIAAPPARVMKAFFDPAALSTWWRVARSVTAPRVLAPFAVEWPPTEYRDDVLGRLGGVFRGTIVECAPDKGFLVADAFWLAPDGDPIGPMALRVALEPDIAGATRVRVTQTGFEENPRWRRYYEVIALGWERALAAMKALLEA